MPSRRCDVGADSELRAGQLWRYRDSNADLDYVVMLVENVAPDGEDRMWVTMLVAGPSYGGPGTGHDMSHDNMSLHGWTLVADVDSGHLSEP